MAYQYAPFTGDGRAWDALIADADGLNLIQSWAYGEAKAATGNWRTTRGTLVCSDRVVGAVQTMIRTTPLPGVGMAWVNRGPLALSDEADMSAMLGAVKNHFADDRGLYLRIAPMVPDPEWDDNIPGLRRTTMPGWSSSVVDLTLSLDVLRAKLHQKWRNGLNKAERSDIEITIGRAPELFRAFKDGHRAHLARRGQNAGMDEKLLDAIQVNLPPSRKILVVHAACDGQSAGAIAVITYGRAAEYLAGHNNALGRTKNVTQRLLWAAIERLHDENCLRLDLGGMDPVLTPPGIFQFKARVNGTPYRLANEFDGGTDRVINKLIRWRVDRQRRAMVGTGA